MKNSFSLDFNDYNVKFKLDSVQWTQPPYLSEQREVALFTYRRRSVYVDGQKALNFFDEVLELGQTCGQLVFVTTKKNVADFLSDKQIVAA